jgi:rod shape-determining protein MreD
MINLNAPLKTLLLVGISLVVMQILMLIALPAWLNDIKPQLVVLTFIYWLLNLPQRVGFVLALSLGLILDVIYGTAFGTHALVLVIITYIIFKWHIRIQFFSWWQKFLLIFFLVLVFSIPQIWVVIAFNKNYSIWLWLLSALTSALIWPYLARFLDVIRRAGNLY